MKGALVSVDSFKGPFIPMFKISHCFLQSSGESLFEMHLQRKLYPSHTYAYAFGGDPLSIVDLTVSFMNKMVLPYTWQYHGASFVTLHV